MVRFIKLPHTDQVSPRKAAHSWVDFGYVLGELINHAIAPLCGRYLAADDLAHLPAQVDQRSVHRLNGPLLGGGNQLDDFGEGGGGELAHGVQAELFDSMSPQRSVR